ncbi:Uma2 family endonuclease [Streptomyces sp. B8F3]|uniref:Uma2 family endonuclease n=1 Tax=Streptomyces sp. B8F3 TaxID=3153573 RepID=UPI00325DE484
MALTIPEREVLVTANDPVEDAFFAASAAVPKGRRVELIEGQIHVTPPANGEHEEIVSGVNEQVRDHRRDLRLYQGIGLELPGADLTERVIPDLVAAPKRSFDAEVEWHQPHAVVLVAEVTSKSTAENDRVKKLSGYARAEIPVYVLVDREEGVVSAYSEPSGGKYTRNEQVALGMKLTLPKPLDFELDTADF